MKNKRGLIVFFVIVGIILVYIRFLSQWHPFQQKISEEMAHNTAMAIDEELVNEKYKDVPSDIAGMTQYDKILKGLDPENGSDSDYDGLTDKEELEEYGSDPLKTSTSGDLYSDGYKVANGLDINKYYDDGEVIYYNLPQEIKLHARYASDNTATLGRLFAYEGDKDIYYKAFTLSRFAGDGFTYDLSEICNKAGVDSNDIGVYIRDASSNEIIDCEYNVEGSIISVNCDFKKPGGYNIYIADKKAIPSKITRFLFGDAIADEFNRLANANEFEIYKGHYKDEEQGLVVMPFPILAWLSGDSKSFRPTAYYNNTYDEDQNNREIRNLDYIAHWVINNKEKEVIYKPSTIVEIVNRYERLERIGGGFFNGKHDDFLHNALLSYFLIDEFDEMGSEKFEGIPPRPQSFEGITGFDIVADTLPFKNFRTTIGVYGNCMGISTLIAKINNTGTNPSSGSSEYSNIEWDISGDEENNTLMDKTLNDYKTADFIREHRNSKGFVSVDLSKGEEEFLKMIGAYFIDGNTIAQKKCPILKNDGYSMYSLDRLRQACRDNLNDKVLILSMYSKDGDNSHGHAVNVHGYFDGLDDEKPFFLRVYDNNFPGEESRNLIVRITPDDRGSFDYEYTVPGAEDYGYSSFDTEKYMFMLMDENHNVIFGSEDDIIHLPEPVSPEELRKQQKLQELMVQ